MACFSLTSTQRIFLAQAIANGMSAEAMEDEAIGALLEELEATDKPIEITVMVAVQYDADKAEFFRETTKAIDEADRDHAGH